MKAKRDRRLVSDGKYNMKAIMQRAWSYKNDLLCTQYRNDFKGALKAAWADARLAMDDHKASLVKAEPEALKKQGNVLRDLFLGNHPDNRYYDSSWR